MRIRFMSDLHLEFLCRHKAAKAGPNLSKILRENVKKWWSFDPVEADITILAGDIHSNPEYVQDLLEVFPKIGYIFGNHEYYRKGVDVKSARAEFASKITDPNFHFLDDSFIEVDGKIIFGGTMWTNLELYGPSVRDELLFWGHRMMNDYSGMRTYGEDTDFRPKHTVEMHNETLAQMKIVRAAHPDQDMVVVTHHGPHENSVHISYRYPPGSERAAMNAFYVSDLTNVIEEVKPKLWIHGHVHNSFDYKVGETRVLTNPRGYPLNEAPNMFPNRGSENPQFDPNMVVDI